MSTTIGQRWAIHRRTSKHDINHHMEAVVVEFAESERALQRQECADAYSRMSRRFGGEPLTEVQQAILTAGVEPTNPYGCACDWKRDNHHGRHILWSGEVYFYSTSCNHCPACGAKRSQP